ISDYDENCNMELFELFENYEKHLILVKYGNYKPEKKVTVGDIKQLKSIFSDYLPNSIGILVTLA
ncbi:19721_t:CDS:1, partial [Cetraspora pellucida]